MAKVECSACLSCGLCVFTYEHCTACGVLVSGVLASVIMSHSDVHVKSVDEQNDIDVRREFRRILEPQINDGAAAILDQYLIGRLKVEELPNEIPRLWK